MNLLLFDLSFPSSSLIGTFRNRDFHVTRIDRLLRSPCPDKSHQLQEVSANMCLSCLGQVCSADMVIWQPFM